MRLFNHIIIKKKEYNRLLEIEQKYIRLTDKDNKGRFVKRSARCPKCNRVFDSEILKCPFCNVITSVEKD